MFTLNNTTETLVLETRDTASLDYMVSYVDHTSNTFTPASVQGVISTATSTTILAAPASANQREVKLITLRNTSTTLNNTVIFKRTVSAVDYHITSPIYLRIGESLTYSKGQGFQPYHANGLPYCVQTTLQPQPSMMWPHWISTVGLAGTKSITTTSTFAVYLGRAPFSLSGVRILCKVTTAAATITWAEFGLAKGRLVFNGSPTLTPIGYTDVSTIVNSTGVKNIPIALSGTNYIQAHDDLWLLVGNQATTALVLMAPTLTDNTSMGFFASATTRPSTTLGTPTAYTAEADTALGIYCMVSYT